MTKIGKGGKERIHANLVDYHQTFNTPQGTRVLADLMKRNYVLAPTFTKDVSEIEMAHREGQRSVVAAIMAKLNTDPTKFMNMIKEMNNDSGSI